VTLARERSRMGLATVHSPHLPDAVPNAARTFLTGKQVGSDIGWIHRSSLASG
jgi:hypothetical protein